MSFNEPRPLGRTGLPVGRLGISSSYGAPARAFEEAFDRGCNYFTWGTFIKGRSKEMRAAIRAICARGRRDDLVLAMYSYAHNATLMELFLKRGLRDLGTDRVDVLILGYYPRHPSGAIMERVRRLQERGLVRFVAVSSHQRSVFPALVAAGDVDVLQVRYSAAHRGAEQEVFPALGGPPRPGVVSFTATRWGRLLDPRRMPAGEPAPTAQDCYRFVLTHPAVDVCMVGAKDLTQMRAALEVLDAPPMDEAELRRMRRIGDHVHG